MISKVAFPIAIALMLTNAGLNIAGRPTTIGYLVQQYKLMGLGK
jgi:hypothetical protein